MNILIVFLLWLAAPTLATVVLAIVLSCLPIKVPEIKPGPDSWFKEP